MSGFVESKVPDPLYEMFLTGASPRAVNRFSREGCTLQLLGCVELRILRRVCDPRSA